MKILGIDTSGYANAVGIINGNDTACFQFLTEPFTAAKRFFLAVA